MLFVCPSLGVGGAERQLALLVRALRERALDPAVVVIRERGPFFDEIVEAGIWARFVEVRSRFDVRGMRDVVAEIGSWPEIVISQGLDGQLVGELVARHAGVRHLTVHHKQPEMSMALHRRALTALVGRSVDGVIAVSRSQLPELRKYGFPAPRVIENGVPEPVMTRSAADVRSELGIRETDFVALLAATLRPEKRARVFVDAVRAAHGRDPRIRGLVAGGGRELEAVRALARESAAVEVLGVRADLPDLMTASDVVCLTSCAEALPMVILEAMAVGRAVISTDVGGVADVVADGETGFVTAVDQGEGLADALCKLVLDPELGRMLGAAARRRYEEHYSLEHMADRYAASIHEELQKA